MKHPTITSILLAAIAATDLAYRSNSPIHYMAHTICPGAYLNKALGHDQDFNSFDLGAQASFHIGAALDSFDEHENSSATGRLYSNWLALRALIISHYKLPQPPDLFPNDALRQLLEDIL